MRYSPSLYFGIIFISILATARAWGGKSHSVVASIAAEHLSESTVNFMGHALRQPPTEWSREKVSEAMARVSDWADHDGRALYDGSDGWHFFSMPDLVLPVTHIANQCDDTGCLAHSLAQQIVTAYESDDPAVLEDAVRFIIHLVADMYQPLHVGHKSNNGANLVKVKIPSAVVSKLTSNHRTNLHVFWDHGLPDLTWLKDSDDFDASSLPKFAAKTEQHPRYSEAEIVQQYLTSPTMEDALIQTFPIYLDTDIENIRLQLAEIILEVHTVECQLLACNDGDPHDRFPPTMGAKPISISEQYVEDSKEAIPRLLITAAVRLAQILNAIVDERERRSTRPGLPHAKRAHGFEDRLDRPPMRREISHD